MVLLKIIRMILKKQKRLNFSHQADQRKKTIISKNWYSNIENTFSTSSKVGCDEQLFNGGVIAVACFELTYNDDIQQLFADISKMLICNKA